MSEIKIQANSSGGGVYTLQSGAGSTDRTLTLPDATTTLSANMPLGYDSWYLNANQTANAVITNWTRRPSASGYVQIGSAMTVSSGVFSFPTTGLWLIKLQLYFNFTSTANDQFQCYIRTGTSGTPNYNTGACFEGGGGVGDHQGICTSQIIFDVTDTTNCVLDIDVDSIGSGNFFVGSSSYYAYTIIEFMKLGET